MSGERNDAVRLGYVEERLNFDAELPEQAARPDYEPEKPASLEPALISRHPGRREGGQVGSSINKLRLKVSELRLGDCLHDIGELGALPAHGP